MVFHQIRKLYTLHWSPIELTALLGTIAFGVWIEWWLFWNMEAFNGTPLMTILSSKVIEEFPFFVTLCIAPSFFWIGIILAKIAPNHWKIHLGCAMLCLFIWIFISINTIMSSVAGLAAPLTIPMCFAHAFIINTSFNLTERQDA